jgi:hypothetical protein
VEIKLSHVQQHNSHVIDIYNPLNPNNEWQEKVENKNLNMFLKNNGKDHVHVFPSTLWPKEKKHKVTLFMWQKAKT